MRLTEILHHLSTCYSILNLGLRGCKLCISKCDVIEVVQDFFHPPYALLAMLCLLRSACYALLAMLFLLCSPCSALLAMLCLLCSACYALCYVCNWREQYRFGLWMCAMCVRQRWTEGWYLLFFRCCLRCTVMQSTAVRGSKMQNRHFPACTVCAMCRQRPLFDHLENEDSFGVPLQSSYYPWGTSRSWRDVKPVFSHFHPFSLCWRFL